MAHRDRDIDTLEAAGVSRFGNSPGMVLEHRLPEVPPPAGVTFDQVKDAAGARDFGLVSGAAYATYGMPPEIALAQFEDDRMLTQPHVVAFVARRRTGSSRRTRSPFVKAVGSKPDNHLA